MLRHGMPPFAFSRRPLRRLLLLAAAALLAVQLAQPSAADGGIPASWALLPVASLAASDQQRYNCDIHTTPAPPPCHGHGTCLLLLDMAADASLPILNSSSAAPQQPSQWTLDQPDLAALSPPLTLCSCDAAWTGRSMFWNRHASDADTCGISLDAILALNVFALVVSCYGAAVASARLLEWAGTVQAKLAKQRTDQNRHHPTVADGAQSPTTHATVAPQQPPVLHQQPASPRCPASPRREAAASNNGGTAASQSSSNSASLSYSLARSTLAFWVRSLHDTAFYIPAATLAFFLGCLAAFPQVLADRRVVLGQALSVDFFHVEASSMFAVVVCMSVHGILRLAGAVTKMNASDQAMVRRINERLRVACALSAVVSIAVIQLTFVMDVRPEMIDPLITTIMLARSAPYWVLLGVYVVYSGEVCRTLLHGIDTLSEQQRRDRRSVVNKLQLSRYVFAWVAFCHCVTVVVIALWPIAHGYLPYAFYLEWACCASVSIARLSLFRPSKSSHPKRSQVAAAPAVLKPLSSTPLTKPKSSVSDGRLPRLPVPASPSHGGGPTSGGVVGASPRAAVAAVVEEERGEGSVRGAGGGDAAYVAVMIPPSPRSPLAVLADSLASSDADGLNDAASALLVGSTDDVPGSVEVVV